MDLKPAQRLIIALGVGTGAATAAVVAAKVRRASRRTEMQGKVVVITGGSRGLGLALAREFGRAGAKLVLAARDQQELDRAKASLVQSGTSSPDNILLVTCDLAKPGEATGLIEKATSHFGRVDVLINNASLIHLGPIEQQPLEAYRESMEVGFFAMVETTKAVLPQMLSRKEGNIVNITSIGGKIAVPHLAPYCATKFAAVGFSETLHSEVRAKGIHVTTVCPGLMRTGSFPNALVVGELEKEYRWFAVSAMMPGISNSARRAARQIFRATLENRTEITIGPEAAFAARFHGLAPATSQALASIANLLLPKPDGASRSTSARNIPAPKSAVFQGLARAAAAAHNEPAPQ